MVQLIYQRTEAKDVAKENEFVLVVCTLLAGAREELDYLSPLVMGEKRLSGKGVEVVDKAADQLQRAGVLDQAPVQFVDTTGGWSGLHAASMEMQNRLVSDGVVRALPEVPVERQVLRYFFLKLGTDSDAHTERILHLFFGGHDVEEEDEMSGTDIGTGKGGRVKYATILG